MKRKTYFLLSIFIACSFYGINYFEKRKKEININDYPICRLEIVERGDKLEELKKDPIKNKEAIKKLEKIILENEKKCPPLKK